MFSHLKSVVKREPVEENIREELAQAENTIHHPVGQPFCVIFFAWTFDGFDSAQSWNMAKEQSKTEKQVYPSNMASVSLNYPKHLKNRYLKM